MLKEKSKLFEATRNNKGKLFINYDDPMLRGHAGNLDDRITSYNVCYTKLLRSTTKITAIVENSDGSRMSRSVAVSFSTTAGTLSATSAKTVNGVASVTLTSSTSIETRNNFV